MDFTEGDEQRQIRELAAQVLGDRATDDFLKGFARSGEPYDRTLWQTLAETGLLGTAIPAEQGGSGLGFYELCLVLEEQGRTLAPVPLVATLVMGALPIAAFGSDAQKQAWLPAVAAGSAILTGGFVEAHSRDPLAPLTTARPDGNGWRLDGEKICVPYAAVADRVLVPAATGGAGGIGLFLVDPRSSGVALDLQQGTAGEPQAILRLDGVKVAGDEVLGDPQGGAALMTWIAEHTTAAHAGVQLGVTQEALRRTVAYATQREQFGRPIGSFQAVQHRAADGFVDIEAMRATWARAAWRLGQGLPAAGEVQAAAWWACKAGQRVVHTTQHLHGGLGADVDYPIHRFFLWAKQLEVALGGTALTQARLGALLAAGATQPLT